MTGIWLK